jgi:hypothetical protein
MPLPRAKYPDEKGEINPSIPLRRTKERLDRKMPEDYAEDPEGELDYSGHGSWGVVYDHPTDPNKAIKYTDDNEEYNAAVMMMTWQKAKGRLHPAIIGVYEAEMVNDRMCRLVLEKVEPARIGNEVNFYYLNANIEKQLKDTGFEYDDWHAGNIGRRSNGEIVILDLGGLYSV